MNFHETQGHQDVKKRLSKLFIKDRIPSAILFLGESGIGKSTLVREFTQMINCETNNSCHTCVNCKLFDSKSHPDFFVIKPSGKFIRISQIHELINQLGLKPAYAKKRVVLVNDAHRLNQESANSFLKLLEEPPLDTLIILMTADENQLLETIISRCQKIMFSPLELETLRKIILKLHDFNEEELSFILCYSWGRIRKDFISNASVLFTMRQQVLNMLLNLSDEYMVAHSKQLDQWIKKEQHEYFLEFCANWIKDFLYLKNQQEDKLTNSDMIAELKKHHLALNSEQLLAAFNITIETEMSIKANANKSLALESLIIQFKQLQSGVLVI